MKKLLNQILMKKLLNQILSALPFNGYKSFIGALLTQVTPSLPPQYQPIAQVVGQNLFALGLAHKGLKENL